MQIDLKAMKSIFGRGDEIGTESTNPLHLDKMVRTGVRIREKSTAAFLVLLISNKQLYKNIIYFFHNLHPYVRMR